MNVIGPLVLVALLGAVTSSLAAGQAPGGVSDLQLKAVYLLNFGRFTTWPPSALAGDTFGVCVLGRDPFGTTLDATVGQQSIAGKPVTLRRIAKGEEAAGCQILFVSDSEDAGLSHLLPALESQHVLTVSDMPRFVDRGGVIQLVTDGRRVRFRVNMRAAMRAGVTLSSELLKVAVAVKTGA